MIKAVVLSGVPEQHPGDQSKDCLGQVYYIVAIKRIFKGQAALNRMLNNTDKVKRRGKVVKLYTKECSMTCGVSLNRKVYLLTGSIVDGKMEVLTYNWIKYFKDLSRHQRTAIREGSYDCACRLAVKPCEQEQCQRPLDTCHLDISEGTKHKRYTDCVMKHGACKKIGDKCNWEKHPQYDNCINRRVIY